MSQEDELCRFDSNLSTHQSMSMKAGEITNLIFSKLEQNNI